MSESIRLMRCSFRGFPIVPILCTVKDADWFGKWFLNVSDSEALSRGPYDSLEEACAAVEATGRYRRRIPDPAYGPHFDPIT